ncbi:MAG: chemotaxis protein CheW [Bacteroidales bacterium]|jgi:purine-binding chemotaxis protein CheW|nr:chemotaxis protein CheW [Bacteroidales bacterium]
MEENNSVTSFKVGGEYFAFETSAVRHILENVQPTRVPLTKPFIIGIINNHGNMIPVVDFRRLLGRESAEGLNEECIVIVGIENDGKEDMVGFKVDEMDDVFEYESADFKSEVVVDVEQKVQRALVGTIKEGEKFIYKIKTAEIGKALE